MIFCIEGTNRKVPWFRLPVPQICSGAKWSEEPKTLSLTTTAPLSHALSSSDRFKFTSDRRRHHHHRHRLVIVIVIWLMKNHISSQEFSKWSLLSQLKSIIRVLISYFLTRNTESSPGQLKSDVLLEMICRWESIQHWVGCLNADVTTLSPELSTAMRRRGQCYWHFYTRNHHYLTRQDNRHLNSNKLSLYTRHNATCGLFWSWKIVMHIQYMEDMDLILVITATTGGSEIFFKTVDFSEKRTQNFGL